MTDLHIDPEWLAAGVAIVLVGAGGYFAVGAYQRRARRKHLLARLDRIAYESAHQVLVPDGMGGYIHIDHLLLTARGLLVLDTRRVPGLIFGGDQMSDWTVMHRAQRYTFANPQPGLYDRIAAVRALAQGLPVEGRIVFTTRGRFPKGLPRHTLMLDSLPSEFPASDREVMRALLERWMPAWAAIRKSLAPSQLAAPKAAI